MLTAGIDDLRLVRSGPSYMHRCRAFLFALAAQWAHYVASTSIQRPYPVATSSIWNRMLMQRCLIDVEDATLNRRWNTEYYRRCVVLNLVIIQRLIVDGKRTKTGLYQFWGPMAALYETTICYKEKLMLKWTIVNSKFGLE